ncbi:hypothetical protein [Arthrobacter glacialis]|uniref:hypothetical protein n=1 Tax=Arthrobacter glacialis TaxID=1664 RepID=UPI0013FDDDED|nr:hypothetical protein [Arthrobacter glacialis]
MSRLDGVRALIDDCAGALAALSAHLIERMQATAEAEAEAEAEATVLSCPWTDGSRNR